MLARLRRRLRVRGFGVRGFGVRGLGVQQKLTLLLTLPLVAVVLTSVPFAVSQVNDAIAANATVGAANDARQVGFLIQDLQQERLLALSYLVALNVEQSGYVAQAAATADRAADVNDRLAAPRDDELRRAVNELSSLADVRRSVLARSVTMPQVYEAYHGRIVQLVDALRLTRQPKADAIGLRQMAALEALLRANEETSRIGAGLVMAAAGGSSSARAASLVSEAQTLRTIEANRFRDQAGPGQAELLDLVEQGPSAERMKNFADWVTSGGGTALPLADLLSASLTSISLARALQERIARDIAVQAKQRAANARLTTMILLGLTALLILGVIWLGLLMSRSVSRPLRRLTTAAGTVADLASGELIRVADSETANTSPLRLSAVDVRTRDEIGELAAAFNRVQATAALLMEQQMATRRNVAVMFANIARRTRSLVVRQLSFIDELERNERSEKMLGKLYRLDHLTTRLRRSADSLFVVSGVREDEAIAGAAPLVDVIRSAVAEIEGYQAVQVGAVCDVTILPQLVSDLRLLLAELLENATAFSPPGTPVEVTANLSDGCRIAVVDHGIGMADDRLAEENERLVRRERLDIAPTSVLGLFVVGRVARRYGLRVRLSHTPGQGVTAGIAIPPDLYTTDRRAANRFAPPATAVAALALPGSKLRDHAPPRFEIETQELLRVPMLLPPPSHGGSFAWFGPRTSAPDTLPADGFAPPALPTGPPPPPPPPAAPPMAVPPMAVPGQPAAGAGAAPVDSRNGRDGRDSREGRDGPAPGLQRRQPGVHLAAFGPEALAIPEPMADRQPSASRDPRLERIEVEAFMLGSEQATLARDQTLPRREPTMPAWDPAPPPAWQPAPPAPPVPSAPPVPAWEPAPPVRRQAPPPPEPAVPANQTSRPAGRGGLSRRVPGAHLPDLLQAELAQGDGRGDGPATPPSPSARDAKAERAAIESFMAGLSRATEPPAENTTYH